MCTVTVVPLADAGFRLMSNRDERLSRPSALPPAVVRCDRVDAVHPTDPFGGGTWIGVNTAGLAVALLNRYDDSLNLTPDEPLSRGTIATQILRCRRLSEAVALARHLPADRYAPFQIVALQGRSAAVATSDGRSVEWVTQALDRPLLFTSSSLGDRVVASPRRRLFDELLGSDSSRWLHGQARFHRHRWPDCPDISIVMERVGVATVSRSTVDVAANRVRIDYEPLRPTAKAA